VTIVITPEKGGVDTAAPRRVSVRLVPPSRTGPRGLVPLSAAFSVAPQSLSTSTVATFDASATRSGDALCEACEFEWAFGDGGRATGLIVSHAYQTPGTFTARLTVSDSDGAVATVSVQVIVSGQPTALFHFSPTPVGVNQDVFLNATESSAGAGRRLVSYTWNFGDGTTGAGGTVSYRFLLQGTYIVLLTVNDVGRGVGHATQAITVTAVATAPTAALTASPSTPRVGTSVFFNASASVGGTSPIVSYRFNYGDGTLDSTGTSATQSHVFMAPGTYIVRVTVIDALGRSGTTTVSVPVSP